jgi:peptidoglycan hydrolase-like protein with peptidoglycan-binding domain
LALVACASQQPTTNTSSLESQIAAANQKSDQALATARQALEEAHMAAPSAAAMGKSRHVVATRGHSSRFVKHVQEELKKDGLYKGKIDGIFGPQTRSAVMQFQKKNGLKPTGHLDRVTLNKLK